VFDERVEHAFLPLPDSSMRSREEAGTLQKTELEKGQAKVEEGFEKLEGAGYGQSSFASSF
jgi:hypothetical protein